MLIRDLSAEIEKFRTELDEHAQVWRDSLDTTIPEFPIRNGDILKKQSERLSRKLGMLRPYINKFGFPSMLTAFGQQWDIYDSAVGMDVAIRKGHSIEKSLQMLQQMLGRLDGMNGNSEFGVSSNMKSQIQNRSGQEQDNRLLVFISHSSKDTELAKALIELLRASLALVPDQIRCTSVDGYRLPVGANTEAQLREEVNAAKVVIALITPNSLSSHYVMFELGARWGTKLPLACLLAGVKPSELRKPLDVLNVLVASEEGQIHQLVSDLANMLGLPLQNTSSFLGHVERVKSLAESTRAEIARVDAVSQVPELRQVGASNFYFLGDKGPYCQPCYDGNGKLTVLTPLEEWNGGTRRQCLLCGGYFYERSPSHKRISGPRPRGPAGY